MNMKFLDLEHEILGFTTKRRICNLLVCKRNDFVGMKNMGVNEKGWYNFFIEISVQPNKINDFVSQFSVEIFVLPNMRLNSHSPDQFSFSAIPFSTIISLQFHSLYQTQEHSSNCDSYFNDNCIFPFLYI